MSPLTWAGAGGAAVFLTIQPVVDDDDNDVWAGWGSVILVFGTVALVSCLIAIVLWQVFKTAQSRMEAEAVAARDGAYRDLAAQSTAAQQKIAEEHGRIADELSELRSRVTTIEKLLSEVG